MAPGAKVNIDPLDFLFMNKTYLGVLEGSSEPSKVSQPGKLVVTNRVLTGREVYPAACGYAEEWSFTFGEIMQDISIRRYANGPGRYEIRRGQ